MATEQEILTSSTRILCALISAYGRMEVPNWMIERSVEAARKLQALLEQEK